MITGSRNTNKLTFLTGIIASLFFILSTGSDCIYAQQNTDDSPYKDFNLILIAINNVGAQNMSLYGYHRKTTPGLDEWAQNALVFENTYTPVSWTLPVITTVFTSLNPYTHKVMDRYLENTLSPDIKILPQIFQANNYATAAFTGGLDNNKIFGHMQGFTTIGNNPSFTHFTVTLKQAKRWLSKNLKRKFFLFIHGYDAHPPFKPPRRFRGVFSNPKGRKISINPAFTYRGFRSTDGQYWAKCIETQDPLNPNEGNKQKDKITILKSVLLTQADIDYLHDLYDETILSIDSQVKRFLDSLEQDLLKKTIVIVFSEHGEMFAKHGRFGRVGTIRGTLYDEAVHVPLMIKLPGQGSRRITGLVQLIDLMPTIMEMLDIPIPCKVQGKSIMPLINRNQPINDYIYSGATYNFMGGFNRLFFMYPTLNESIRDFDWKLIHEIVFSADTYGSLSDNYKLKTKEETFELYDLKNDPNELKNVTNEYPEKTKELTDRLNQWSKGCRIFNPYNASTKKIPEGMVKDAQEHGYW